MAKTEDVAQFLKGTSHADEVGFLSVLSQATLQNKKIQIVHHPPHKLSSASSVELIS
jgi:hypothetical protein